MTKTLRIKQCPGDCDTGLVSKTFADKCKKSIYKRRQGLKLNRYYWNDDLQEYTFSSDDARRSSCDKSSTFTGICANGDFKSSQCIDAAGFIDDVEEQRKGVSFCLSWTTSAQQGPLRRSAMLEMKPWTLYCRSASVLATVPRKTWK